MGEILYYICIFPLEQLLDWALYTLFKATKNYGTSIILLSLVVNLFLLKIFLYTDRKAQAEAALKEKLDKRIKGWKSVYKKAKLYAFTQTLYKQHHYHPIFALRSLGGLALQIPFFWAMYEIIKSATYLQHVSFLWIADLSKPDSIALFGLNVHVLPLLMTAFTLINVFYSTKEKGARIQGTLITLFFLVLLYDMPSSLVLYWTCNMLFAVFKEMLKNTGLNMQMKQANISQAINYNQAQNTNNFESNYTHLQDLCNRYNQSVVLEQQKVKIAINNTQQIYELIKYSVINLAFMVCIYIPYNLYVTDLHAFDLDAIPLTLAALFGFFLYSVFIMLYIINFFNKNNQIGKGILYFFVWLFIAIMLLAISYTFVFQGDYGVMSYFLFEKQITITPNQKIIDFIMIPTSLILAIPLAIWFKKYMLYANKILIIALTIGAMIPFVEAMEHIVKRSNTHEITQNTHRLEKNNLALQPNGLLDFSKNNINILVLILDRSDGYVVHELFQQNTQLKDSFQGFIDFTNALSSSGFTLPTLTSIIGGEYYTALNINERHITNDLSSEIAKGYAGIFNAFNKAGYATSGIVDYPTDDIHLYPLLDHPNHILFSTPFLENRYIKKYLPSFTPSRIPVAQLISYGLFRISTFQFRLDVYKRGRWFFTQDNLNKGDLKSIAEMNALVEATTAYATKPTFKFIHNSLTHNPYSLNESCVFTQESGSPKDAFYSLPNGHYNSEKCAWEQVAQMLKRLQELGVYDNTEIFITADHGAQSKFLPINYNLHIPLFYKPLHAKGVMRQDSRIITNYDIPALFCNHIQHGCPNMHTITLNALMPQREVRAMQLGGGWTIKSQHSNSFKINAIYTFKGDDIYDKKAWEINAKH